MAKRDSKSVHAQQGSRLVPLGDRPSVRPLDLERAPTPTVFYMTSPVAKPVDPDPKWVPDAGLPIAEVAQRTGLSKDTLRYYEKAGLIEAVDRSSAGQRRYAITDLDCLAFLMRLRATGMSIADMQLFAELRRKGSSSVTDRLDLLTGHRDDVQRHIADLQGDLQVLDTKITHYQGLLDEQTGTDQL